MINELKEIQIIKTAYGLRNFNNFYLKTLLAIRNVKIKKATPSDDEIA